MKKAISIFLSLAIAITLIARCSSPAMFEASPAPSSPSFAPAPAPSEAPVGDFFPAESWGEAENDGWRYMPFTGSDEFASASESPLHSQVRRRYMLCYIKTVLLLTFCEAQNCLFYLSLQEPVSEADL